MSWPRSSGGAAPCVFAWIGGWIRRVLELMMTTQMHHLNAIGVEAFIVDKPFSQHQRLRRPVRLDIDLALQALEVMAVRIQQILVEGDAIVVHGRLLAVCIA